MFTTPAPDPARSDLAHAQGGKSWNRRETVAELAAFFGGIGMLRKISQSYELRSRPGRRLPALGRVSHAKYLILCYHRVGMDGIPYYCTLAVSQFEMQMRYLRKHCRILSLGQLLEEVQDPRIRSGQAVAVTFDDGYSDLHRYALPVLRKYNIPATVYLTANCIETGEVAWYDRIFLALQVAAGSSIEFPTQAGIPNRLPLGTPEQRIDTGAKIVSQLRKTPTAERKALCALLEEQVNLPSLELAGRMLSWSQVREMRSAGIFFGSHTLSHPVLSQLPIEEVEKELRESKSIIENRLGEPALDFAYPFGKPEDCGSWAYELASRSGYRSAVTTTSGYNTPTTNMYALRRVQLGEQRTTASFALQLHRAFFRGNDGEASIRSPLQTLGAAPAGDEVLAQR